MFAQFGAERRKLFVPNIERGGNVGSEAAV